MGGLGQPLPLWPPLSFHLSLSVQEGDTAGEHGRASPAGGVGLPWWEQPDSSEATAVLPPGILLTAWEHAGTAHSAVHTRGTLAADLAAGGHSWAACRPLRTISSGDLPAGPRELPSLPQPPSLLVPSCPGQNSQLSLIAARLPGAQRADMGWPHGCYFSGWSQGLRGATQEALSPVHRAVQTALNWLREQQWSQEPGKLLPALSPTSHAWT